MFYLESILLMCLACVPRLVLPVGLEDEDVEKTATLDIQAAESHIPSQNSAFASIAASGMNIL